MRRTTCFLLVLLLFVASVSVLQAAAKPKPKAKPKTKTAKLASIGTSQLPGDWCDIGKTYTLGKKWPWNVTVKSVEYCSKRLGIANDYWWPTKDTKYLIVRFSLQNPLHADQNMSTYFHLNFTAVDALGRDCKIRWVCVEGTGNEMRLTFKPAQKVECYAVIPVAAAGEVPKLMLQNDDEKDAPVARYDLHGKIKPIEATYADAKDTTGSTLANEIHGTIGKTYQMGAYDVKVDSVEFVPTVAQNEQPAADNEYLLATLEYTSWVGGTYGIRISDCKLKDADGSTYTNTYETFGASSLRVVNLTPGVGETAKFRIAYRVPKGVTMGSLNLVDRNDVWPVVIDLTSYKSP